MDLDITKKAVAAALKGNWQEAVDINKEILKEDPKSTDALNRLSRAYAELGNFDKARLMAEKVLKIDPFNTIAAKSLNRWKDLKPGDVICSTLCSQVTFLEEPGKTKIVSLLCLGTPSVTGKINAGEEVKLETHSHRVNVTTEEGKYIGRLPDDLSARLRYCIKQGNRYLAIVKSADITEVKLFIKESERCQEMEDTPTFPPEKADYIAFTPENFPKREKAGNSTAEDEDYL